MARKGHVLRLTGTPPVDAGSEKGRLVAPYCPIVVDYTTDEAVLAGMLNGYCLVVSYTIWPCGRCATILSRPKPASST